MSRTRNRDIHQHGFTIIEILVALVISLILLMGVINIFLASKQSYTLQNGVSRMQENARYALDIMADSITRAGRDLTPTTNVLPFSTATADGGGNASDTIAVQYANATDCLGNDTSLNPAPTTGIAVDVFAISAPPNSASNPNPALTCNGTTIVDGVESMQILYGLDQEKSPLANVTTQVDGVPESYVPYSSLPTTPPDDKDESGGVTSVRIAILVSSVTDPNTQMDTLQDVNGVAYSLLDAPALPVFKEPSAFLVPDRKIRRIFTRTVLLRNYLVQPKNPGW